MRRIPPEDIPYFISVLEKDSEKEKTLSRLLNNLIKKHSVYGKNGNAISVLTMGGNMCISGLVIPMNRVEDLGLALLRSFPNRRSSENLGTMLLDYTPPNAVVKPELSFYKRGNND